MWIQLPWEVDATMNTSCGIMNVNDAAMNTAHMNEVMDWSDEYFYFQSS